MVKTKEENDGYAQFIMSGLILAFGIILIGVDIPLFSLSSHWVTSAGIGIFAIGSFIFIVLVNSEKNSVVTDEELLSLTNALVIYAGILTMFIYENVLRVETVVMTISVVLLLGTAVALLTDWANLDRFDVVE